MGSNNPIGKIYKTDPVKPFLAEPAIVTGTTFYCAVITKTYPRYLYLDKLYKNNMQAVVFTC